MLVSGQTPRKWFEIKNAAAEVAEVSIFDEISPWGVTAQDFITEIRAISAPSINLHLNTPGGDVYDGIAIYNELKNHPAQVHAYIPGLAASIGTVIAMAADDITIAPHARMMIHDAWMFAAGNAEDFAKHTARLEATSQNLAEIYAERAPQKSADEWRALMKAETWLTDSEAVDVGLADSVGRSNDAKSLRQAALFNLKRYRDGERVAALLREDAGGDEPAEQKEPLMPDALRDPDLIEAAIQKYEQEQAALEAALSPSARR